MDLLKTLLLYMAMVYASSVQNMPDTEAVMVALATPTPVAVATVTPTPVPTPSPTPVPTVAFSPNPQYKKVESGDNGDLVRELQEKLKAYGYYNGEIDGRFGNQTRQAVQLFQYNHGLYADGIAGKNTLTVLYDSGQVRYAQPTASPTPEPGSLKVAITPAPETPAPTFAPAPKASDVVSPDTPAQTTAVGAADTPSPAPSATATPSAAPAPEFLSMEGWVIQIAGKEAPIAFAGGEGEESVPITPYTHGLDVYVPLLSILQANDLLIVPSDDIMLTEYAFALGKDVFRITYTETQDGAPTDLKLYKNNQEQFAPIRDAQLGGNFVYLPAETVSSLTGITFSLDSEKKILLVSFPQEQAS